MFTIIYLHYFCVDIPSIMLDACMSMPRCIWMKLKSSFFRGYEQETGESSWTPPDDATSPVVSKSWATFYDDDGNIFYYNHVCGVDMMYAKRFF